MVKEREREFKLVCQLDSAASCNVLAYRDYRLERSCTTLTMYDGSVRRSMGSCLLTVRDKEGLLRRLYFEVLDTKQHSLLSLDSCLNLHLLQYNVEDVHLTGENHVTREWIVREFPGLFQGK